MDAERPWFGWWSTVRPCPPHNRRAPVPSRREVGTSMPDARRITLPTQVLGSGPNVLQRVSVEGAPTVPPRGASMADPYDFGRFVDAQDGGGRLRRSRGGIARRTQGEPLDVVRVPADRRTRTERNVAGRSPSRRLEEARAYLGPSRPRSAAAGVRGHRRRRTAGRTAEQVFGAVDAQKLRSSMTLFMRAAPEQPLFRGCSTGTSAGFRSGNRAAHPTRRPATAFSGRAVRPRCRGTGRATGRLSRHPGHSPRPGWPCPLSAGSRCST